MFPKLHVLIFVALLCGFGGALAQPAGASSGPTLREAPPTSDTRQASGSVAASNAEMAVLQAQLAVMQVFTDRILSTVYWAIGGVFAIAALLVGYNAFSSHRMQDREIANLRSDLQQGQDMALAQLNVQVNKLTEKYEAGITAAAEAAAASGLAEIKKRLDLHRALLDRQQTSLARLTIHAEARYWELSNVGSNEIRPLLDLLQHDLKTGNQVELGGVLMRIQELLSTLEVLYPDDANRLNELLGKLPAEFDPQIAAVQKVLATLKLG
jgi:hypothetical protein